MNKFTLFFILFIYVFILAFSIFRLDLCSFYVLLFLLCHPSYLLLLLLLLLKASIFPPKKKFSVSSMKQKKG